MGSKYDKQAGTKGSGDKTYDKKLAEAQDQADKDRKEQQGENDNKKK
jgi:hypothetical protein